MKYDYVYLEIIDSVAIVTINRPPLNALNSEAYGELFEVFYKLSKNEDIKVVILTGSGEKSFVAGADVNEFLEFTAENGLIYTRRNQSVREFIRKYNKPVICSVNGLAYGGGCALALVCDIKITCPEAKFNLSEINMGILGATQYVSHVAHFGTACKMVYSGESISAEEALRIGLIDEIVSRENLMERSLSLAKKIASKPPLALKYAKLCMLKSRETFLENGLLYEENIIRDLWNTKDKNEAVNAFLEKRKPKYEGK